VDARDREDSRAHFRQGCLSRFILDDIRLQRRQR
jgi:hypothetical protein